MQAIKTQDGRNVQAVFPIGLPALKYTAMISDTGVATVTLLPFDVDGRDADEPRTITVYDRGAGLPSLYDTANLTFDTINTALGVGEATPGRWSGAVVLDISGGVVYYTYNGTGKVAINEGDDILYNMVADPTLARLLSIGDVIGGGAP